ncbi:MAG: hypothetical protein Hals2KO_12190 [Halioglobus sp.]
MWLSHCARAESSERFRRRVLASYTGIAATAQRYSLGEHGKPALAHASAPAFNISHSGDWLACVVAEHDAAALGVDMEVVSSRRDIMTLARRFYAPAEVARLEALRGQQRLDHFYDLWTLKEAAVKARGEALAPSLNKVRFDVVCPTGDVGTIVPGEPRDTGPHYYLLEPVNALRLAICCRGMREQRPRLRVYQESTPGEGGEVFPILRAQS